MIEGTATGGPGPGRIELRSISKSFPGVQALRDVSLRLEPGEIHALLGENGAGKTTVIKVITGVEMPDQGQVVVEGREVRFRSPRDAFRERISVVHQERTLASTFTVGDNVLLEQLGGRSLRITSRSSVNRRAQQMLDALGIDLDPRQPVERLSTGQQQMIEIARALSSGARVLLLDEPTASISLSEAETLLETLRRLREGGVSLLYVTHRLEEVFAAADVVTVLRDGESVGHRLPLSQIDRDGLIELMVGRKTDRSALRSARVPTKTRPPVLNVDGLQSRRSPVPKSFSIGAGEILGWYGMVGSGRTELARTVIGADRPTAGTVSIDGRPERIRSVGDALAHAGIAYISESREEEGLFMIHDLRRNVPSSVWRSLKTRFGFVSAKRERELAQDFRTSLDIRAASIDVLVGSLSGGNKQKVSIAKGLATRPRVLIMDEPTVGIDVRTKSEVHHLLVRLAEDGVAVIIISSDLPEVIDVADRILIFGGGRIMGVIENTHDYDQMSRRVMSVIADRARGAEAATAAAIETNSRPWGNHR